MSARAVAFLRIEMLRRGTWTLRAEGEVELTPDQVRAGLPAYCVQYIHRAYLDGELVAECKPVGVR